MIKPSVTLIFSYFVTKFIQSILLNINFYPIKCIPPEPIDSSLKLKNLSNHILTNPLNPEPLKKDK